MLAYAEPLILRATGEAAPQWFLTQLCKVSFGRSLAALAQ
ncbi:hypothetical protein NOR51B_1098 [Luminiphilus syltensis NOR5-1B]|uniref:Uncharacterized protein n=1 Tax=Luminiphilus syltensis NOR5-1B TaxID=565045 RepID=B8KSJ1_9GAMM|nr:hypothetical protein NOR51B_1098 [Luminiphilus syltensis NOR5-1B]